MIWNRLVDYLLECQCTLVIRRFSIKISEGSQFAVAKHPMHKIVVAMDHNTASILKVMM